MLTLGLKIEHIAVNTPEQNGHIESFHKTLKKEYIWSMTFKIINKPTLQLEKRLLTITKIESILHLGILHHMNSFLN